MGTYLSRTHKSNVWEISIENAIIFETMRTKRVSDHVQLDQSVDIDLYANQD
jgi:hypothetical protein